MDSSTQITTAAYDPAKGTLREIQSLPIDTGYAPGQSTEGSEIRVIIRDGLYTPPPTAWTRR